MSVLARAPLRFTLPLASVLAHKEPSRALRRSPNAVHLDEWVAPDIADDRGHLRVGKVLEWMDVTGVLAATRHCQAPVVTASVDALRLHRSVEVGARVTMDARVAHTSERSMGISVGLSDARGRRVAGGYMTFVALSPAGHAVSVPQVAPETPGDRIRQREGELRRALRQRLRDRERAREAGELRSIVDDDGLMGPAARDAERRAPVHKIEPVRDGKLNFHGTLYGGTLMRWMETTASVSARAFFGSGPLRLTEILGLEFVRPIRAHTFVHLHASVATSDACGIVIVTDVSVEDPLAGARENAVRGYLRFERNGRFTRAIPRVYAQSESERHHAHVIDERTRTEREIGEL